MHINTMHMHFIYVQVHGAGAGVGWWVVIVVVVVSGVRHPPPPTKNSILKIQVLNSNRYDQNMLNFTGIPKSPL